MTSGDVARLLGISRQGVAYLLKKDPSFPEPLLVTPVGRLWARVEIERWARETGRIK